jgi:hypothetical protein
MATPIINNRNIQNVREQIAKKLNYSPYIATIENASDVLTDYDTFPYNRYFRGVYDSFLPVVAEREAGWRPRNDSCYKLNESPYCHLNHVPYPNHCFESACSTVYPCYPEYLQKDADKNALNVILNKSCILQYR